VERHGADLESQTGHDEDQTEDQHLVLDLTRSDGLQNFVELQAARGAVEHGHAVQQEARGHGAQHEVLHGGFGGHSVVTAQGHQGVARQCEQFQAQVDHDEVLARDHEAHAQERKQGQAEQFTTAQHVAVRRIGTRIDQRDQHGNGGKALEPMAQRVADDQMAPAVLGLVGQGIAGVEPGHTTQGQQGQHMGRGAAWARDRQVNQRDHAGHDQQHDFRIDRHPAGGVHHVVTFSSNRFTGAAWTAPHA
jgi:hypothetical protein